MKKFLSVLLLLSLFVSSAYARPTTEENDYIFTNEEGDGFAILTPEDIMNSYLRYDPGFKEKKILYMPTDWVQNDYYDIHMGTCDYEYDENGEDKYSIGKRGCGLTAFAIVRDYYLGSTQGYKDPTVINEEFMIPYDLCGMNWSEAASFYGLKVRDFRKMSQIVSNGSDAAIKLSKDEMSTIYNVAKTYIEDEQPVIIWVNDDDGIYANHFLLIVGYATTSDGDMLLYVQNTASKSYGGLSNVLKKWEYVVQFDIIYQ